MAAKPNWGELAVSGSAAVATALYGKTVEQRAGAQQAAADLILISAVAGLFDLFTKQAGLVNDVAEGVWGGGLATLFLTG